LRRPERLGAEDLPPPPPGTSLVRLSTWLHCTQALTAPPKHTVHIYLNSTPIYALDLSARREHQALGPPAEGSRRGAPGRAPPPRPSCAPPPPPARLRAARAGRLSAPSAKSSQSGGRGQYGRGGGRGGGAGGRPPRGAAGAPGGTDPERPGLPHAPEGACCAPPPTPPGPPPTPPLIPESPGCPRGVQGCSRRCRRFEGGERGGAWFALRKRAPTRTGILYADSFARPSFLLGPPPCSRPAPPICSKPLQ